MATGETVSHYRILEKLGAGGMGEVYAAKDLVLHRRVAIKFPVLRVDDPAERARFLREARLASALNHPNIATIHDAGEAEDGRPFLVMELVAGEALNHLLQRERLGIRRSLEIVGEIGLALEEAHRRGIIHRDIKPSNVILSERGPVKVLDFGLAKQLHPAAGPSTDAPTLAAAALPPPSQFSQFSQPGAVIGTPLYMSPEQARGESLDGRSDLFSLGVTLYECLTGQRPFVGGNADEARAQILYVDASPPSRLNPRIPPELDRLTLRALAKDPATRHQTAGELIADLRAVQAEIPDEKSGADAMTTGTVPLDDVRASATSAADWGAVQAARRLMRLPVRRWAMILLGMVLASAGMLAWWLWPRSSAPRSPQVVRLYEEGIQALRDGAYLKAKNLLESATTVDNRWAMGAARLAEAWMELDNVDAAAREIARARALAPDLSSLPAIDAHRLQAINLAIVGSPAEAIPHYQEIARLEPDSPYVDLDLGRACERNRKVDDAISHYQRVLERDPGYAAAHLRLGVLYGRKPQKQEKERAANHFAKAEEIYRTAMNADGVAEVALQRGLVGFTLNDLTAAQTHLTAAYEQAKRATPPNDYQQIRALLQLSNAADGMGDAGQAMGYVNEALGLARERRIEYLATLGLIILGEIHFNANRLVEAERYLTEGLEQARRYRTVRYEARAAFDLGSLKIDQDRNAEGLKLVREALKFFESGGYQRLARKSRQLIGRALRNQGDYEGAQRTFEEILQQAESSADEPGIGEARNELGQVFMRLEQYPKALNYFQESLRLYRLQKDRVSQFYVLLQIAAAHGRLGRFADARASLAEAEPMATGDGWRAQVLQAQMELANLRQAFAETKAKAGLALKLIDAGRSNTLILLKLQLAAAEIHTGSTAEGRKLCAEAVELASGIDNPFLLARARYGLAEALLAAGETAGARDLAREAGAEFRRAGQRDSELRALLLAARASRLLGDAGKSREEATEARRILERLAAEWAPQDFNSYRLRPDIAEAQKQLDELLAGKT